MGKLKKAFKKVTKNIVQNVSQVLPGTNDYKSEKMLMALATGGVSLANEQSIETLGKLASASMGALSGPQQAVAEDTSVLSEADAEEMRKRKLLESQARNASGVRAQSVLNPV